MADAADANPEDTPGSPVKDPVYDYSGVASALQRGFSSQARSINLAATDSINAGIANAVTKNIRRYIADQNRSLSSNAVNALHRAVNDQMKVVDYGKLAAAITRSRSSAASIPTAVVQGLFEPGPTTQEIEIPVVGSALEPMDAEAAPAESTAVQLITVEALADAYVAAQLRLPDKSLSRAEQRAWLTAGIIVGTVGLGLAVYFGIQAL